MKKIILFISTFASLAAFAQDDMNLVTNPSFESSSSGKLKKLKQINIAESWDSPTALKADLYDNSKDGLPCSAPANQYGNEEPMDGSRYAGITAYSYNNKQPRTYIQTQLLGPLEKDVDYCIKFYVSLSDQSKYAINNLGMYISKDPLEIDSKEDIIFEKEKDFEHVALSPENVVMNGRYNWFPICATYKATGKEQYITIGNFYNNKDTKYEKLKKLPGTTGSQLPLAYYYVDQVEVFIMDDPSQCDCSNTMDVDVKTSVVYHKNYSSEDGISPEEQIKYATIYFDNLKTKFEQSMIKDLDNVAAVMAANPDFKIELSGYSDQSEVDEVRSQPENEEIRDIAKKRAKKVKEYLVEKGIDASRISIKEQTASESAFMGSNDLEKAKNRKVEFTLLK